jgi:probable rRNA maturation factor
MSDDPDSPSNPDTPQISIVVTVLTPAWRDTLSEAEPLARRAARAALAAAEAGVAKEGVALPGAAEVGLVLADDATLGRLNRRYRGVEGPTNVLSFAASEGAASEGSAPESSGPLLLGDVVLAYETVRRESEEQGKRFSDHLCHLVVHGVLHLLGYEHGTEAQAAAMERLEIAALAGLGVSDPYVLAVPS